MLREILTLNDWNTSDSTEDFQVIHVFANRSSTQTVNGAIKDRWMQDISSVAKVAMSCDSSNVFLPILWTTGAVAVLNPPQLVVFFLRKELTHIGHSIVQLQSAQNFNDLFLAISGVELPTLEVVK